MERRIVLTGPIAIGKSTLLETCLRPFPSRAGGFLTRRVEEGGRPRGYCLLPVGSGTGGCFLDLTAGTPRWEPGVFFRQGCALLRRACEADFAILDEVGGPELLLPAFSEALYRLLSSAVPAVCVVKCLSGAEALSAAVSQPQAYFTALEALWAHLRRDAHTRILEVSGHGDPRVTEALLAWRTAYGYGTDICEEGT